jgi:hypothetical protein
MPMPRVTPTPSLNSALAAWALLVCARGHARGWRERAACPAVLPWRVGRSPSTRRVEAAGVYGGVPQAGAHRASRDQASKNWEAQQGRTTGCRRRQTASARASLPLSAAPEPQRSGSSRQGCASDEVKGLCRQWPDADGKPSRGVGRERTTRGSDGEPTAALRTCP